LAGAVADDEQQQKPPPGGHDFYDIWPGFDGYRGCLPIRGNIFVTLILAACESVCASCTRPGGRQRFLVERGER
jgi:hypothetical protein